MRVAWQRIVDRHSTNLTPFTVTHKKVYACTYTITSAQSSFQHTAHSRHLRYFRRAVIIAELNNLAADSQQPRKRVQQCRHLTNHFLFLPLRLCKINALSVSCQNKRITDNGMQPKLKHLQVEYVSQRQIYLADLYQFFVLPFQGTSKRWKGFEMNSCKHNKAGRDSFNS